MPANDSANAKHQIAGLRGIFMTRRLSRSKSVLLKTISSAFTSDKAQRTARRLKRAACYAKVGAALSIRIISTWALTPAQRQLLEQAGGGDIQLIDGDCRSRDQVGAMVEGGCDILLTLLVPDDLAERAPGLKWMQLLSAGADHVPEGLIARNVSITTASGIHATAIAEYILGSMLAWTRRLHVSIRAQQRHEWLRVG